MKKLLYLLPVVLVGLSAASIPLYKDRVDYAYYSNEGSSGDIFSDITKISPNHWKMLNLSTDASGGLDDTAVTEDSAGSAATNEQSLADHLYKDAKYYGFPAAAYFTKSSTIKTSSFSSTTKASGWSYLWAGVDGALVLGTLLLAFIVNRKKVPKDTITTMAGSNPMALPAMQAVSQPVAAPIQGSTTPPVQQINYQPPQVSPAAASTVPTPTPPANGMQPQVFAPTNQQIPQSQPQVNPEPNVIYKSPSV